ncbi:MULTISPECIES: DMT family transporter [Pseudomonas]|uniref:DMT family transporter n=1 Tax=Pseudomonas quebecensis TaxID=2995174 RepID=A0ABY6QN74_9PSED|nr:MULTISPECIES: DMT family transporter [Pseudomonas]MCP1511215.1 drug/metabolite transporter (DMT)-like permease [Pseudomonas rhodesiae]MCX4067473.1 DMT family transporter [Pseudomonas quebecensis]MDF9770035.1 drug/metabolite transporter (DMT)-like permease [Pseudomonas rhodesiae]UZW20946.1 DMT family transporter [Pseudomonas quebecensis]UZW21637.1 DMT family transporter [Pseudomonas quebecensis]
MHPTSDHLTYCKLAAVTMIWGGTFVAGRYLADHIDPLLAASLRFILASLALLLFMALARIRLVRPTGRQLRQLALLGFFGIFFYNLCFFYGLHYINASRASLIVALNPAVIGLASSLLFKEQLGRARIIGIALCLGGAATVIVSRNPQLLQGAPDHGLGDLLILGCVLGWGIYSLYSRELNASLGPLQTVTWSVLLGAAMLAAATAFMGGFTLQAVSRIDLPQALSLGYLGVLGSALAYIGYYDGIRRIGATRSGVFIALNPLTAVICGALLLGEPLSAPMLMGGAVILWGIYLCNKPLAPARVMGI